jgi:hypothetical protein
MSRGGHGGDAEGGAPANLSVWHRLLLLLPRFGRNRHEGKAPLGERLRDSLVKPVEPARPSQATGGDGPRSVEELEAAVKSADDRERLVGFAAAPLAAIITIVVTANLIADDPAARRKNGTLNPAHVSVSLYHELAVVLVVLTVLILVTAMLRKRLFLGLAMAMFGLAIFDLHGWGFGIPYILGGSWFLVRAYRLQRELRDATGGAPSRSGGPGSRAGGPGAGGARPGPNKRYTPPVPPRRSPPPKAKAKPKPEDEKRAG